MHRNVRVLSNGRYWHSHLSTLGLDHESLLLLQASETLSRRTATPDPRARRQGAHDRGGGVEVEVGPRKSVLEVPRIRRRVHGPRDWHSEVRVLGKDERGGQAQNEPR